MADIVQHDDGEMVIRRIYARETVRDHGPCPRCKAERAEPCHGTRGPRKANHQARVNAYAKWLSQGS